MLLVVPNNSDAYESNRKRECDEVVSLSPTVKLLLVGDNASNTGIFLCGPINKPLPPRVVCILYYEQNVVVLTVRWEADP